MVASIPEGDFGWVNIKWRTCLRSAAGFDESTTFYVNRSAVLRKLSPWFSGQAEQLRPDAISSPYDTETNINVDMTIRPLK